MNIDDVYLDVMKYIAKHIPETNPKGKDDKPLLNIAAIGGFYGCGDWLITQIEAETINLY